MNTTLDVVGSQPWAFSDGNASTAYTTFSNDLDEIETAINWKAVAASDWRDPAVKDKKQAEFLVYDSFPWSAIQMIGVFDKAIEARVKEILGTSSSPKVSVQQNWYY